MTSNINHGERYYRHIDVKRIEEHYKAHYVGDFAIRQKDGSWSERPVMVFYQPFLDDPKHTHYFGVFPRSGQLMICDASSIVGLPMLGIESGGEIVYSRYRHDFRQTSDGKATIDGGRDYTKRSGSAREIWLVIIEGEIKVIPDEDVEALFIQHKLAHE